MRPPRPRTDDDRAALARAWLAERDRLGTTQEDFARSHGIAVRTLRGYVARYAPRLPPVRQLRAILGEALNALQALALRLDELDAGAAAGQAGPGTPSQQILPATAGMPPAQAPPPNAMPVAATEAPHELLAAAPHADRLAGGRPEAASSGPLGSKIFWDD